jgi:hypothetical protein
MGSGQSQPQLKQQEQLKQQQKPVVQSEKTTTTTVGSAATAFLRPIRTVSTKVLTEEESKRILTVGKHRGI